MGGEWGRGGSDNRKVTFVVVTFKEKSFHFYVISFKRTILILKQQLVAMKSCATKIFYFYVTIRPIPIDNSNTIVTV